MRQGRGRGRIVQQMKEGGRVRVREVQINPGQEEIREDGSKAGGSSPSPVPSWAKEGTRPRVE